jgi:hypothetical protein
MSIGLITLLVIAIFLLAYRPYECLRFESSGDLTKLTT